MAETATISADMLAGIEEQYEADKASRTGEFREIEFQATLDKEQQKIDGMRQMWLAWYDEKTAAVMAKQQQETEYLQFALDTQTKAHQSMWTIAGKARDTFSIGLSNSLMDSIKKTGNLKESFVDLGFEMVKTLLDYGIQMVVNKALASTLRAAELGESTAAAGATAAAWAPAAGAVNAATFGGGAIAGLAALASLASAVISMFKSPGLAEGGTVTGGGTVLVGERGPEFLNLPAGARVTPLDKAGSTIYVNIEIYGNAGDSNEELIEAAARRASEFIAIEARRL